MAFPTSDYPRTELLIDGTWTDVSGYVLGEGGTQGIQITRGRAEAQSQVNACTSAFRLDNRDGRFSNRNPSSTYYGLLPRTTQVRHLAGAASSGDTYLWLAYDDQEQYDIAYTADKAVLDVVGDLEIRCDVWPHTWRPDSRGAGNTAMLLATKFDNVTGNQRSWFLYLLTDGTLVLGWSTAGTSASGVQVQSTASVPATSGRLSIKVTLDVNNGAAGNDVKFYTAASIDGSYTQLGATVTTAGVTSVFASTALLVIGGGSNDPVILLGTSALTFGGRFYEFRLYNGIGGTLVANPKFYNQTIGTTSFSDGLGTPNTWILFHNARIISDRQRFHGELSALPQVWDSTGDYVYCPVQASGVLRRLSQGGTPLRSPIYRQLIQYAALRGYWPLEDGSQATDRAASALSGGLAATTTSVTFAAATTLPGAASTVQFASTTAAINASVPVTTTGTAITVVVFLKLSANPAAGTKTLMTFYTSGTARRIEVGFDNGGNWHIDIYAADGTSLAGTSTAGGPITPVGQWVGYNLLLSQNGANVDWYERWLVIGKGNTFSGIGPSSYAGTVGRCSQVRLSAAADTVYQDAQFGHLFVATDDIGFVTQVISDSSNGYVGERAATRIDRLCTEEGVTSEITGMWDLSAPMGVQGVDTLLNLLYRCAEADMGMLGESRTQLAVTYRTRGDLDARRDLELDYSAAVLAEAPLPNEDVFSVANDVTASRIGGASGDAGGSARKVITSGALSTATPPAGIGTFATSVSVNTETDGQLEDVAGWLAHIGSWDEARYPNLRISLHRSQITGSATLPAQITGLDVGDTIALTDLPSFLPPDDALLLVQGYTELLTRYLWDLTINCTPAGPYRCGMYDYAGINGYARYDTSGSTLNTTVTSSATTIILDSTDTDDVWTTTSGSYPFDIMIDGERITLTTAPGATSPQTFTSCTRSVNGVSKAHTAGAAVVLAEPIYWAV